MIAEEEIGSRIDAMVEAGPDGEEEQPKDVQPVQLEDPAAAAAASPIGDDAAGGSANLMTKHRCWKC